MNVIPNIGLIPFLPDPQTGWVSIPPILGQLECNTTAKAILTWFRQTNWHGPVKVLIPQSNAFGHKISSINVAKRLAELRLMNQVILIPEQPQIEQQVVRLLTTIHKDLAWGKSVSSNDVTITAMPCASLGSLPRKGIGFTGGFESSIGSLKATLKVEHAIMLQPPAWKSSCCLSIPKVPRLLAIELEKSAYYPSATFTPRQIHELYPNCEAIDMSMFSKNVLMCPIYGLHHPSVGREALSCLVSAVGALAEKLGKFGVVVVFGDAGSAPFEVLPKSCTVVDKRKTISEYLARGANKGRVLVVTAGVLPPAIFDTFMAASNLPFIFEGAGTLSLALSLGKPYVRLLGNDMNGNYYPTCPGLDKRFETDRTRLDMLGRCLALEGGSSKSVELLYNYFLHCVINREKASQYFHELRKHYHRPARDKVFLSLAAWFAAANNLSEGAVTELLKALKLQ